MLVFLHRWCMKNTKRVFSSWPYMFFSFVTVSRRELTARAADRQTVTLDEHRITQARVEEVGRETGHLDARVVALEEGNRGEFKVVAPAVNTFASAGLTGATTRVVQQTCPWFDCSTAVNACHVQGRRRDLFHACAAVAEWETVAVGSGLSEDLRQRTPYSHPAAPILG